MSVCVDHRARFMVHLQLNAMEQLLLTDTQWDTLGTSPSSHINSLEPAITQVSAIIPILILPKEHWDQLRFVVVKKSSPVPKCTLTMTLDPDIHRRTKAPGDNRDRLLNNCSPRKEKPHSGNEGQGSSYIVRAQGQCWKYGPSCSCRAICE